MLKTTNTNFDIIAISETRILKNTKIVRNINIPNFSYEFTPTESTAGGTLIYIADHLAYQKRNDLTIYSKNYLESTFIEIMNPSKTNIIVGCIYRHPSMDLNEFNYYYLNPLLEKLAKEQKTVFLLGEFNVDLSKHEQHIQLMNSWILCLPICFFLRLPDLPPIQSLLLIFFQSYLSGNNLR